MRALISLTTRSAIRWSRSVRVSPASTSAALRIDIMEMSAMLWPSMVTARVRGLSRAPPHSGQGTSRM